MKRTRYQELAAEEDRGPTANYYGFSRQEWYALTPEQRVTHYNRREVCEHKADLSAWPELLREQMSIDPYASTPHSRPHSAELFFKGLCECQGCEQHVGIPRDERKKHVVDVDVLREKLKSQPGRQA